MRGRHRTASTRRLRAVVAGLALLLGLSVVQVPMSVAAGVEPGSTPAEVRTPLEPARAAATSSLHAPARVQQGDRFRLEVLNHPARDGRRTWLQEQVGRGWQRVAGSRQDPWGRVRFFMTAGRLGARTYRAVTVVGPGAPKVISAPRAVTVVEDGDVDPPHYPDRLRAFVDDGELRITWEGTTDPDLHRYRVYHGPAQFGPWNVAGTTRRTRYTDYETPSPTARWYTVTSVDALGNESAFLPARRARGPEDRTPPPSPREVVAGAGIGEVELSWSEVPVGDLAGYQVYRAEDRLGPWVPVGEPSDRLSETISGLTNGTTYWFGVSALDRFGNESGWSTRVGATPRDKTAPPVPTGLSAVPAPGRAALEWIEVDALDVAGYHVYRATSADGPWRRMTPDLHTDSRYTDTGVLNRVTHWYAVTSEDASGNESDRSGAVPVTPEGLVFPPDDRLDTGHALTCRIRTDHRLQCWGRNSDGQLGRGAGTHSSSPVFVDDESWSSVAVGASHGCGIRTDRTLWCWGRRDEGQAGSREADPAAPTQLGADDDWMDVDAGGSHSCGIREDGSLWCWGADRDGVIYLPTGGDAYAPVRIGADSDWVDISTGDHHACALRSDGSLWCWGYNHSGELGIEGAKDVVAPAQVGSATDWTSVSAGFRHTCGVREGSAWCWGENGQGQLGDGTRSDHRVPVSLGQGVDWTRLTAGRDHTCGVRTDGSLWCWGLNYWGQLGDGMTEEVRTSPVQVRAEGSWADVGAGVSNHSCAVRVDGRTSCWGYYGRGEVGTGHRASLPLPVDVTGLPGEVAQVSTSQMHGCAVTASHQLWCWGRNANSELGDGTTDHRSTPAPVVGSSEWRAVTTGYVHTCAVSRTGTAWCWGWNVFGQLGTGSFEDRSVPALVGTESDWRQLDAGGAHTCGIRADSDAVGGSLWCWGSNNGQLGTGDHEIRTEPTQVGSDSDWTAVSSGSGHTCGVRVDGTLWCWGNNEFGQSGTSPYWPRHLSPVQVGEETSWAQVTAGASYTCGVKRDGSGWCWGSNASGRLGVPANRVVSTYLPVEVSGGGQWRSLTASSDHTCGIRTDMTAWCWGVEVHGQLGDGTPVETVAYKDAPTMVAVETGWLEVSVGHSASCGIRDSGTLACWGHNEWGNLGIPHQVSTPQPVDDVPTG